jgi:succinyl-diaminopimelate desuccinylase
MIRIRSLSSQGNEEIANFVAAMLQDRGLKTQLQQVTHSIDDISKRQFNVIGVLGDPLVDKKIRKGLLLCAHLDTMTPGLPEAWTETGGDPFSPVVKEGKIFGLGSADSKLDFLCKLRAIEKFREKKLSMPVYLVGTCGEEIGMLGVRYLIKSLALNPRFVLVGEPTDLKLVHTHKAVLQFKVSVAFHQVERDAKGFSRRIDLSSFGRAAHGSQPAQGVNAISQMTEFLSRAVENGFELRFTKFDGGDAANKVPDLAKAEFYMNSNQFEEFKRFFRETVKMTGKEKGFRVELGGLGDTGVRFLPEVVFKAIHEVNEFFKALSEEFTSQEDAEFNPPVCTTNLSLLRQAQHAIFLTYDLRLLPKIDERSIESRVMEGVKKISSRFPNLNISIQLDRGVQALRSKEAVLEGEFVKSCMGAMTAASIPPSLGTVSAATEASAFLEAGYETLVFGAGKSDGNAGSANEFNTLEGLERAIAFYEQIIEKVCL